MTIRNLCLWSMIRSWCQSEAPVTLRLKPKGSQGTVHSRVAQDTTGWQDLNIPDYALEGSCAHSLQGHPELKIRPNLQQSVAWTEERNHNRKGLRLKKIIDLKKKIVVVISSFLTHKRLSIKELNNTLHLKKWGEGAGRVLDLHETEPIWVWFGCPIWSISWPCQEWFQITMPGITPKHWQIWLKNKPKNNWGVSVLFPC